MTFLLRLWLLILGMTAVGQAFVATPRTMRSALPIRATVDDKQQQSKNGNKKKPNKRQYTLAELSSDVVRNPAKYTFTTGQG